MKRRSFIQGIGAGLLGTSLFPLKWAHGAENDPPKRLLIFFTEHGIYHPTWELNPSGLGEDFFWEQDISALSAEEFSPSLLPLYAHRHKMRVVDGIGLISAELDQSNLRHQKGTAHALTGANGGLTQGIVLGGGPSIDQLIAQKIGREDRWASLELGVGKVPFSAIYQAANQVLPHETDPLAVHQRLFGATGLARSGRGHSLASSSDAALDVSLGHFEALKARLGSADREKLETHRKLLEDVRKRVNGLSSLTCSPQEAPLGLDSYEDRFQAMVPLIAAALSCDMTRVITLQMGDIPGGEIGYSGDVHQVFAHKAYQDEESADVMTAYQTRHARQLADLLDALEAIPEGNGTLLDNTHVVWMSELGNPAHGFDRTPAMSFGATGRKGTWIHYPSTTPLDQDWLVPADKMGMPHQRFLLTLAHECGVSLEALPITELLASDGSPIDCRGILEELV